MERTRFLFGLTVLVAASLACNLTVAGPEQAAGIPTSTSTPEIPTASPTPSTATPGATASPTIPLVSVSTATNCREGPSTDFAIMASLTPGQSWEVVGKNTVLNYWIVKIPGGGQCWLWGQYATVVGNTAGLPEIPAPPLPATATPAVPKPVTNLTYVVACQGVPPFQIFLGGTLSWEDKSDNEDGFRVYRGDTLVATLGPGSTSYDFLPSGTYGVEAFNASGSSIRKTTNPACP